MTWTKGFPGSSSGKESTCNAGDAGSIPGLGRRDMLPTPLFLGFPDGSAVKESACNVGDLGSIPGWRRSPGEGNGYPLQYSGLENSMDLIVHGVAESDTTERLSLFRIWTNLHALAHSKKMKNKSTDKSTVRQTGEEAAAKGASERSSRRTNYS